VEPSVDLGPAQPAPGNAGRVLWILLIVAGGLFLTPMLACATPFAALATLAALKLGRRDAFVIMGLVWAANQVVGYGFLGYPRTWDSLLWGLAICASAGLATLAARGLAVTRPAPLAVSLPFVAAFATFELCLYAAGYRLPGSEAAFSAPVVGHVFLINAAALCGVMTVHYLAMFAEYLARSAAAASTTPRGASFQ
jgi:hypothetical protein